MAKRTYRKKSGYARRRKFRRTSRKSVMSRIPRSPKYDGMVARKFTHTFDMDQPNPVLNDFGFKVFWGLGFTVPGGAAGTHLALSRGIDFPEHVAFLGLFRFYQIRGVSVSLRVPSITGGQQPRQVNMICSASETRDTTAMVGLTTTAVLQQRDDYKRTATGFTHKRYVGVSKWVQRQRLPAWAEVGTDYCDPSTTYRIHTAGYVVGDRICQVEVTYYVVFRGAAVGPPS